MDKLRSFRTSNFTLMPIMAEIFLSPQTHYDPISGKNKMKFKNSSPENNENPFALSFKVNFMTIHA